ncbi:hypothetical protein B0H14DRAFT_2754499, partial [Mycena olivaceomarginata]
MSNENPHSNDVILHSENAPRPSSSPPVNFQADPWNPNVTIFYAARIIVWRPLSMGNHLSLIMLSIIQLLLEKSSALILQFLLFGGPHVCNVLPMPSIFVVVLWNFINAITKIS